MEEKGEDTLEDTSEDTKVEEKGEVSLEALEGVERVEASSEVSKGVEKVGASLEVSKGVEKVEDTSAIIEDDVQVGPPSPPWASTRVISSALRPKFEKRFCRKAVAQLVGLSTA